MPAQTCPDSKPPAPPNAPPGLEGKGNGTGVASYGARDLHMHWLNRHYTGYQGSAHALVELPLSHKPPSGLVE